MKLAQGPRHALNAVCPYFTMFPLDFPLGRLKRLRASDPVVLDVFCGRGTTLFAARLLGLRSYGLDISPVATAIARAKLARATPDAVVALAEEILSQVRSAPTPRGEFWRWLYHPKVLDEICRLRKGLLRTRSSDAAHLLRAIMLGALHGPLSKSPERAGYFSNQMPRTFASKPDYSVRFWRSRCLLPPLIDTLRVIRRRADRALAESLPPSPTGTSKVRCVDSRDFSAARKSFECADIVITSPPYYGMTTYVQDQWLRNWFVGGEPEIDYSRGEQLSHLTPTQFAADLASVWDNVGRSKSNDLSLLVRFGGLQSRKVDPLTVLRESFARSKHRWRITRTRQVPAVAERSRQANQMCISTQSVVEWDVSLVRC